MMNFNKLKIVPWLLVMALLSACNSSYTTKKNTYIDSTGEEQIAPESAWQQAYGEPQEVGENTLAATAEQEPEDIARLADPDLWQRVRTGFTMPKSTLSPKTEQQLAWFVENPDYIDRVVERARPYLHYIVEELDRRDMPMEIALLPVVESAYQPFAYSRSRAAGLWQFIPGTGRMYGLKQDWWYDGRRDVAASTHAALDYLQRLHKRFGTWELALAAYNGGEGTVSGAIKRNQKAGKDTDFWSLKLSRETSAYVPKLLAIALLVEQPEKYNISLSPIDDAPFLTVVDIGGQIDLALAAKLAEISIDEMYQLNPGYNQWATKPYGPHQLLIPIAKVATFQQALDALPANERVQWTRHKIKSGDSLGVIAQHYKTTIAVIKEANGLRNNNIRAGRHILIPIASGKASDYPLTASQRLATRQNSSRQGNKRIHTVKKGDTWWDIAIAYNVNVRKLTSWNNKAPGDILRPGQKLVVWTTAKISSSNNSVRSINYKIRSGDSLWVISQKFKVSVAQVLDWNNLSERTLLKPGQNLTLHVDVTQQSDSI